MLYPGKRPLQVFLSAGEASGDLHGAELVHALLAMEPEARITCLGGVRLREAGAEVIVDNRDISVVGLVEVARHARTIHAAWKTIRAHLSSSRPDVMVLIDFPDFNFLLARLARRLGIRVFYYVSPQVWAWRSGRVRTIKRCVDRMAVILPFEAAFYARHGMTVDYVGHPLLDVLAGAPSVEEARERYRSGSAEWVVGLLPGSRRGEIRLLLPLMLDSAELIRERLPGVHFLLPVAQSIDRETISREVRRRNLPIRIVSGDTYGAMRASDLLITASGTVTLEAAILGTPMVITYRVSDFSYFVGRRFVKVDLAGLPNLIAGRIIAPELLQHDAKPELLARTALSFLESPARLAEAKRDLLGIRGALGSPGVAERVARLVLETAAASGTARTRNTAPWGRFGGRGATPALVTNGLKGLSDELPERSAEQAFPSRGLPRSFHVQTLASIPFYPFLALYYAIQSALKGKYRSSRWMRLGLELPEPCGTGGGPRLWVHALSVGESHSVVPLVKALKTMRPDVEVVFSTATETGQAAAREQLSGVVNQFFHMPHDFPWAMERLLRRVRPSVFVLIETDVWPGLLMLLKHHLIPAILVNGRISPRSFRRMVPMRPIMARVFKLFDRLLVQSEDDRKRYVALGTPAHRVEAMGNLKFDAALSPLAEEDVSGFQGDLGLRGDRKVWVAGSTHEGEEGGLIQVHEALLGKHDAALLILAPRDIRRAGDIGEIARRKGMRVGYRSRRDRTDGVDVYLLDTFGELRLAYGLADAAFIGGSLVAFGGHNPLEAVAQGKPVCWGPHLFNFREIELGLLEAGCGTRVEDFPEMQGALLKWLEDPAYREQVRRLSGAFMQKHGGTAERMARFLSQLLLPSA
ncbi:MAG: lipid-A-disaccharide synthase [Syntrophobacteraceae bacterium]